MAARKAYTGSAARGSYSDNQIRRGARIREDFDGNAVRKLAEPAYQERIEEVPDRHRAEQVHRARRNREKAMQMSPAYVLFLTAAFAVIFLLAVNYIKIQTSITTRMENVAALQTEVEALVSKNEEAQQRISASSDMNEIYRIATEELGMVYPSDSQIIYYDQTEREYVQQYESIPTE